MVLKQFELALSSQAHTFPIVGDLSLRAAKAGVGTSVNFNPTDYLVSLTALSLIP